MCRQQLRTNKSALAGYRTINTRMPDQPDILKYIDRVEKVIYINHSAKPGANIIRLLR